jgi:thiol-disulfide isomerase/thioredoxin
MKIRLLLILSLFGISIACFPQKYAIVKGRVTPAPAGFFASWYTDPLAGTTNEIQVKPDTQSGLFLIRMPINTPTFLHTQGIKTLLLPGDTAQVDIKNNNGYLTITFTGKDSARFNFSRALIHRIERSYARAHDSLSVIQNEHNENLKRYDRFATSNNRHLRFKKIAQVLIASTYYHNLLLYHINNEKEITANIFEEMNPGDLNEGDMLFSEEYLDFVFDFNRYYYANSTNGSIASEWIENAKKKFKGAVQHALLFYIFKTLINECDMRVKSEITGLKNSLINIFALDQGRLSVINKLYKQYDFLQQPVPFEIVKAKLLTENNQLVSFEDLIKIHKKPLYLDFWASWCGPCINEMQASKKIHQEMSDEFSFVYVSIDRDDAPWKKGIDNINLNGTHVRLTADQTRLFHNYFGIEGIPHYAIIDVNGRLAHFNAPRPSEFEHQKKIVEPLPAKPPVAFSK